MSEIPKEALQAAAEAVLSKEWAEDAPWSVHNAHNFNSDCAVCQGDVPAIVAVVAQTLAARERLCPNGCGRPSDQPHGGPCKACMNVLIGKVDDA